MKIHSYKEVLSTTTLSIEAHLMQDPALLLEVISQQVNFVTKRRDSDQFNQEERLKLTKLNFAREKARQREE